MNYHHVIMNLLPCNQFLWHGKYYGKREKLQDKMNKNKNIIFYSLYLINGKTITSQSKLFCDIFFIIIILLVLLLLLFLYKWYNKQTAA